jgi:hypothetical protein
MNDPRTSMDEYWVKRSLNEDYAGNFWHFLSIFPCAVLIISPATQRFWKFFDRDFEPGPSTSWQNRKIVLVYLGSVILTFVVFALLYKWQRTGSRLQLPFFILWAPLFGMALENLGKSRLARTFMGLVALFFMLIGIRSLIANPSRPLVSWRTWTFPLFEKTRIDLLFMNSPEIKPAYLDLAKVAQDSQCKSIGLMLDSHDPEYPLWAMLAPSGSEIHFEHLFSIPELERYIHKDERMCSVICSICNPEFLEYMTKTDTFEDFSIYFSSGSNSAP